MGISPRTMPHIATAWQIWISWHGDYTFWPTDHPTGLSLPVLSPRQLWASNHVHRCCVSCDTSNIILSYAHTQYVTSRWLSGCKLVSSTDIPGQSTQEGVWHLCHLHGNVSHWQRPSLLVCCILQLAGWLDKMNWQLRTQPSTVTVASRCCIIARMDQNCATLEHTHILIILNNHMLHRHLNNDLKICYNPALLYIYTMIKFWF